MWTISINLVNKNKVNSQLKNRENITKKLIFFSNTNKILLSFFLIKKKKKRIFANEK